MALKSQLLSGRAATVLVTFLAILASQCRLLAAGQNGFTDADIEQIDGFLHESFDSASFGMVIGLVDERGSRVLSAGKLHNGADDVNGETLFWIGSVTKTFTTLLLQDMVARGEMRLDDPVTNYLPKSVKVPSHGGREITLVDLATHTSGLRSNPDDLSRQDPYKSFAAYTAEKLYAFLSKHTLDRDPGAKYEYSDMGMALLAHAITLRAATDYESLVVERICRPLHMDCTRITLTPELQARLAIGHDPSGNRSVAHEFHVMTGAGALRSTANDLVKYVSANLGLMSSSLMPLMEKTHVIRQRAVPDAGNVAMDWMDRGESEQTGKDLLGHGGATGGYQAFVGLDKKQRRGVVVLSNQRQGDISAEALGWLLLEGVRLTPQITAVLSKRKSAELSGVGVKLEFDRPTRTVQFGEVVPNSPAAQAGLSRGLVVQSIYGIPTAEKSMMECISLLRGKAGTTVRLELANSERQKANTVELTRQPFQISK